jgi:dihydrofolate reductase
MVRKLKLQAQMSLDGFVAGPSGEMDWMTWNWDDALKNYVSELTQPVDTILLGRKMAAGFIESWSQVASDPNHPEHTSGKKFIEIHKVVFSNTLTASEWENTSVATGDLLDEIADLKAQNGQDMIVYGGASFVSALVGNNLIDEYHLFINPVVLGSGMAIFNEVTHNQVLTLVNAISFECGIALLHYQRMQP